ncbi:MAG TPA: YciI family protein [Solirubrobacterales bacterium]|nr:YciI family protein [Solirubrobacterales bacterium]
MKYLLTFLRDQDRMYEATEEEMKRAMDAWNAFDREAIEAGALIAIEPLEEPASAKTIRVAEDGEHSVTDGPFAETKEQLGGFCLLECASLEEAIGWAEKVPMGAGAIEVRAVKDSLHTATRAPAPGRSRRRRRCGLSRPATGSTPRP